MGRPECCFMLQKRSNPDRSYTTTTMDLRNNEDDKDTRPNTLSDHVDPKAEFYNENIKLC